MLTEDIYHGDNFEICYYTDYTITIQGQTEVVIIVLMDGDLVSRHPW